MCTLPSLSACVVVCIVVAVVIDVKCIDYVLLVADADCFLLLDMTVVEHLLLTRGIWSQVLTALTVSLAAQTIKNAGCLFFVGGLAVCSWGEKRKHVLCLFFLPGLAACSWADKIKNVAACCCATPPFFLGLCWVCVEKGSGSVLQNEHVQQKLGIVPGVI